MENLRGIKRFIFITIILSMLMTVTGCLSMIYYPARVADKGKMYLGIGTHMENFDNDYIPAGSIFFRRGFGQGVDIGCEVRTFFFVPSELLFSVRKEFQLNDPACDAITIDAGYSHILLQEAYISAAFLKDEYALRTVFSQNLFDKVGFDEGYSFPHRSSAFSISLSKEFKWKKVTLMPFILYKYSIFLETSILYPIFQYNNMDIREKENTSYLGAGISFLFNI